MYLPFNLFDEDIRRMLQGLFVMDKQTKDERAILGFLTTHNSHNAVIEYRVLLAGLNTPVTASQLVDNFVFTITELPCGTEVD